MDEPLWWILPNPRWFIDAIEEAISVENCLVIEWPQFAPDGLANIVEARLDEKGAFRQFRVSWSDRRADDTPTSFLCRVTLPPGSRPTMPSAEGLVNAEPLDEAVVWVDGIDLGSVEAWQLFLKVFVRARDGSRLEVPPIVCLVVPNVSGGLKGPGTKRIQWFGTARSSDIVIYVSMISKPHDHSSLEEKVKHSAISHLAGYDPKLATFLSNLDLDDLFHPEGPLRKFAADHGLSPDQDGKSAGWLTSLDGEEFIHSALLTLVNGGERVVEKRIINGQMTILLPWLENVRLRVALAYKDLISLPIHMTWGKDVVRIDDIEDVEFSHIGHQLRRKKIKGEILTFVSDCRDVRNKLSHGVLIENAKLKRLIDGWKAIQEVLPQDKILVP